METVRDSWTDERLDDMSRRMELGFAEVKIELRREIGSVRGEISSVRGEIGSVRSEIGSVRGEIAEQVGSVRSEIAEQIGSVRQEIGAMDDRLHSMQRLMVQFQGVLIAALIGLIATQI